MFNTKKIALTIAILVSYSLSAMERPKRTSKPISRFNPSDYQTKNKKRKNEESTSIQTRQPSLSIDTIKHLAAQASDGFKHNKSFYANDGKKYNINCHLETFGVNPDYVLTSIPSHYSCPPSIFETYSEETEKHLALHPTYCVEDLSNNNRPGNEVLFLNSNRELIFENHIDGILLPSTASAKEYSHSPYKNLYR